MELDFIFITYHTNTHIFVVLSIFMHLFIVLYTIHRRHTERKECYTLPYLILHTLHNLADFPSKMLSMEVPRNWKYKRNFMRRLNETNFCIKSTSISKFCFSVCRSCQCNGRFMRVCLVFKLDVKSLLDQMKEKNMTTSHLGLLITLKQKKGHMI